MSLSTPLYSFYPVFNFDDWKELHKEPNTFHNRMRRLPHILVRGGANLNSRENPGIKRIISKPGDPFEIFLIRPGSNHCVARRDVTLWLWQKLTLTRKRAILIFLLCMRPEKRVAQFFADNSNLKINIASLLCKKTRCSKSYFVITSSQGQWASPEI